MVTTPAGQRAENSEIRDWARANGWPELGERGAIPAAARGAFSAAHGPPAEGEPAEPGEPGPDDQSADGDDDDWAEIGDPAEDSAAAAPPPPPAPGEEPAPAPANLDEARDRVRDARSAHLGRAGRRRASERLTGRGHAKAARPQAEAAPKITPKVIGDIEGKMAFWLGLTAEPWMIADPYCGGAYADSIPGLAHALAPLICQSPDLVRMLTKSSQFILWTNLLMAARPVATAVIAHHVMKTVELEKREEGQAQAAAPGTDFARFSRQTGKPAAA